MRHLRYIGLGSLSLFFIAVALMAPTIVAVDAWHDQWVAYAAALEGCADAATCTTSRFDLWKKVVPGGMVMGALAASLALTSPFARRRRTDT